MPQYLAAVVYRCLVAGVRTGKPDIQVQWHNAENKQSVQETIAAQKYQSYKNSDGETVTWELVEIFAIEPFAPKHSGEEVIGFIASTQELGELS